MTGVTRAITARRSAESTVPCYSVQLGNTVQSHCSKNDYYLGTCDN